MTIENLSIQYEEKSVVEQVSFAINSGERILLRGKNGSGKSSIIKAILGEVAIKSGEIKKASDLKISYVSQDTSALHGTLYDYAIRRGVPKTIFLTLLRQLDFERIEFERPIESFSEGQKKKVLIAVSLCEQAHLYIWDEPLNYIDLFSRIQIENLLKKSQLTLLFVEHDSCFANEIATKIIELS